MSGGNKHPRGSFAKVTGQDSPKNTVRIAQLEKPKDQQPQITGENKSMSMHISTELSNFKEEMKEMMKEMNQCITKNVSTSVTTSITSKIEELDSKFSAMFSEYKTDLQSLKLEGDTVKKDLSDVSDKVIALETSVEFTNGQQKDSDEKQTRNLNKMKAEIDTKDTRAKPEIIAYGKA